jgi:integrase
LLELLESGELPQEAPQRFRDAHKRFIAAAKEGRALNKHGRRYKPSAWEDLDECLEKHVIPTLGPRRLTDVRRSDVQRLIDDLTPKMSGSRVRSIVNAIRSMYRWAQDRDLVASDPAARVRLPAMNATARDRIAAPAEFAKLLAALEIEDALPYALAGYAMGRRAQIQRLRWRDVDLGVGAVEWGVEQDARKSRAAQRVVPTVKPLLTLLKRAWIRQGRPGGDHLVCPPRRAKATGLLHTGGLTERAMNAWKDSKLQPIGLHECRHTAATWLDAAGVSPKVASVLMGHAIPDRQPGAASITLARYTHVMPDAMETARKRLDEWLAAQLAEDSATG